MAEGLSPEPEEIEPGTAETEQQPTERAPEAASIKVVSDPESEYENLDNLFVKEKLGENIDDVRAQMEELSSLISVYNHDYERFKKEPDDIQLEAYVDEALMNVEDALKSFKINGKQIDLTQLPEVHETGSYEDQYNFIANTIRDYQGRESKGITETPLSDTQEAAVNQGQSTAHESWDVVNSGQGSEVADQIKQEEVRESINELPPPTAAAEVGATQQIMSPAETQEVGKEGAGSQDIEQFAQKLLSRGTYGKSEFEYALWSQMKAPPGSEAKNPRIRHELRDKAVRDLLERGAIVQGKDGRYSLPVAGSAPGGSPKAKGFIQQVREWFGR